MEDVSRVFWLKRASECTSNEDTLFAPAEAGRRLQQAPGELFLEFYDEIRKWVQGRKHSGVAVIALDEDGVQAKAYLRVHPDRVNTAIVGRHEKAEIFLGDDPMISLRHLAVIASPGSPESPGLNASPRVGVVDLRTASGMSDEHGVRIRACESDEPFLVRAGSYFLLFAPCARGATWPERPETMSDSLRGCRETLSLSYPSTVEQDLLGCEEEPLGELVISSEDGEGTITVGRRAARSGILLGRSDRCDRGVFLDNPHISRVHAMIVEVAGKLYAIDTASKNGVWGQRGEERAQLLESGTTFSLCGLVKVEWRFFH